MTSSKGREGKKEEEVRGESERRKEEDEEGGWKSTFDKEQTRR